MAFIAGTDTFNSKKLGEQGSAVIGSERHVYYTPVTVGTNDKVASFDVSSTEWVRVYHIESYDATDNTNKIEIYDGKNQTETKEGKVSSELKIAQTYKGWLNSIGKLQGQDLWFAEAITDDRKPLDAQGKPNYFEIRFVKGKLTNITEEKGDAEAVYKINGEGSYNVSNQRKIFAGITPITVTTTQATTATTTVDFTVNINAKDFKNNTININSLTADSLMGEITNFVVETVTGTPVVGTQTYAAGTGSDGKVTFRFTGTGSTTLRVKAVTASGGEYLSATTASITVS